MQKTMHLTLQPLLHAESPVVELTGLYASMSEKENSGRFPTIDSHTLNDMRINYAQGSRQAELATVDGAEMSGGVGEGGGITGQQSPCHRGIVS